MGTRGQIAKIERDGSGRYVYLGHAAQPAGAGTILLEHYQDPALLDALLDLGSMPYIAPDPAEVKPYVDDDDKDWRSCAPIRFTGGTDAFFLRPRMLAPEWLYAWTPDGWLAAPVQRDMPRDYMTKLSDLTPDDFQDWFDHNQSPEWQEWRAGCRQYQQPRPLATVIRELAEAALHQPPTGNTSSPREYETTQPRSKPAR